MLQEVNDGSMPRKNEGWGRNNRDRQHRWQTEEARKQKQWANQNGFYLLAYRISNFLYSQWITTEELKVGNDISCFILERSLWQD